jgi:hypothetical protein
MIGDRVIVRYRTDLAHFARMRALLRLPMYAAIIVVPGREVSPVTGRATGWDDPRLAMWVVRPGGDSGRDMCERCRDSCT